MEAQIFRNQHLEQSPLATITSVTRLGIELYRDWTTYIGTAVVQLQKMPQFIDSSD